MHSTPDSADTPFYRNNPFNSLLANLSTIETCNHMQSTHSSQLMAARRGHLQLPHHSVAFISVRVVVPLLRPTTLETGSVRRVTYMLQELNMARRENDAPRRRI